AAVLAALVTAGARPAEPGEFTRRAVLNGQVDLLQAEAIGDLIDARSQRARRAAIDQLDGGLSRRVLALRDALITLEALIAYDIDFPEEDDGPVPRDRILHAADDAQAQLEALLATARAGELVREGALVVIAGAPNAGKSSLFNALLGRRRAIVTDVPGTTRDALEAVLDAGRWPLRLVDTAGLRQTDDLVEQLGVEVSTDYLGQADIVLACGESDDAVAHVVNVVTPMTKGVVVPVRTKDDVDASDAGDASDASDASASSGSDSAGDASPAAVSTSAERGTGLGELVAAIEQVLDSTSGGVPPDTPLLTHLRHRQAIDRARGEVAAFREGWASGALPAPVAAVHLREGVHVLEELVGAVDVEDVLSRVFSSFCIGK
nr:50S ribosome-binding GTPase [Gemmatimonadaceae bacterium]